MAPAQQPAEDLPRELVPPGRRRQFIWPASARTCARCAGSQPLRRQRQRQRRRVADRLLPAKGGIDTSGLDLSPGAIDELLTVSRDDWKADAASIGEFFGKFGDHLPSEMDRSASAW
jgi:GTP-dependent phosphoenolpyruvate carboxykinase